MNDFSILIPTLNEADNIDPLLASIEKMAAENELHPEIIFIDDGSSDATCQRINQYIGKLDVQLIRRTNKRGLAGAVICGAHAAKTQWIVVMDGDLSHPPDSIPAIIDPLIANSHDMVIGSRYTDGGSTPDWPLQRLVASRIASFPACVITGVSDPLAGFFAIARERLIVMDDNLPGFKIGLELLAAEETDLRVKEVPITFKDRCSGVSKMRLPVVLDYLKQLVSLTSKRTGIQPYSTLLTLTLVLGFIDASMFNLLADLGFGSDTSHIVSFLFATHLGYFITPALSQTNSPPRDFRHYLHYLTLVLLLLLLRGGGVSLFEIPQTPEYSLPLLLFIGTSFSMSWPLAMIVSDSAKNNRQPNLINWKLYGSLLIGYTILLRLIYIGSIELIQEEAYYWNYAQHMASGYLDHPPAVALIIKLSTMLFGNTEFGVRFGAFICWFITAFFAYKLSHSLFDKNTAFISVILVAALPIFFGVALVITPDAPLIACWAGALYYLYRALVEGRGNSWYAAGIMVGLGLASKYTIGFLLPAILLFMVIDRSARKWLFKPQPYLAAIIACILFSPVILWNYHNGWASFLFQSSGRIAASSEFSTHELIASILVLLTPTGFLAAIAVMRPHRRLFARLKLNDTEKLRSSHLFCLTMALIPLAIFTLFSLTKEIKLNWTGPIWLSILPFIAYALVSESRTQPGLVTRMWPQTLVILTLCYGTLLHYCALGLPGVSFASGDFLFGWDNLAAQIEHEVTDAELEEGERPIVVGLDKYKIASGLAFYRNKQIDEDSTSYSIDETTGRHLFGSGALMYNYWHPLATVANRDILVISPEKKWLVPEVFHEHYQPHGKVHEISINKRGKKAGSYYCRLLTWYTPEKDKDLADTTQNVLTRPVNSTVVRLASNEEHDTL